MLILVQEIYTALDRIKSGIETASQGPTQADLLTRAQRYVAATDTARVEIASRTAPPITTSVLPKIDPSLSAFDSFVAQSDLALVLLHSREVLRTLNQELGLSGDPNWPD